MMKPSELGPLIKAPAPEVAGKGGEDDVSVVAKRVGLKRREDGFAYDKTQHCCE